MKRPASQPRHLTPSSTSARSRNLSIGLAALYLLVAAACQRIDDAEGVNQPADPPAPQFVYVPSTEIEVRVRIAAPEKVRQGEPVRLHATKESIGEWKRIRYTELPPNARWFARPWPAHEAEVAANLTWKTDPPMAARYDVGLRSLELGMQREAVFKAPGTFKIWALNATPYPAKSNVVTVDVRE
jgi:hypothetical protein